jgi:4'-phosphopantetheinyl transferase
MTCSDLKKRPKPVPFPGQDEVHLWRVKLSTEPEHHWHGILATDEQERAHRFHFAADRHRFTVTRGLLWTLLGRYIEMAPESLCFAYNEFGKPSLVRAQNPRGIQFNVAHSGDCSLLVFGLATHLGVDIEHLRIERNAMDLARAILSTCQYAPFLGLPDAVRKETFFKAWTRREAIAKAIGGGLFIALDNLRVEEASAPEWSIRNIEVNRHYAAAIAIRARHIDLRLWDWTVVSGLASTPA